MNTRSVFVRGVCVFAPREGGATDWFFEPRMNTDWHGWERVQRQSPALYSLVPLFLWGCATRVAAGIGRAKLLLSPSTAENSGGSAGASPAQGMRELEKNPGQC